jgi:hypothetical protein
MLSFRLSSPPRCRLRDARADVILCCERCSAFDAARRRQRIISLIAFTIDYHFRCRAPIAK